MVLVHHHALSDTCKVLLSLKWPHPHPRPTGSSTEPGASSSDLGLSQGSGRCARLCLWK